MKLWLAEGRLPGTQLRGRARAAALLACGWPLLAAGQLGLQLRLPVDRCLCHEAIRATVTVRNETGQLISLGAGPTAARLDFEITDARGALLPPRPGVAPLAGLELLPGGTGSRECDLARRFSLGAPGRYRVAAVVDWQGVRYGSAPVFLDVCRGLELARLSAGIPDDPGALRVYALSYLQRGNSEEHLYLQIEDQRRGDIYGVFNLGRVVRVRAPLLETDEAGNIHVLFQTAGMDFVHTAFTPYGEPLSAASYPGQNRVLVLQRLPDGRVSVGGLQAAREPPAPPGSELPRREGPITRMKNKSGGLFGSRETTKP